MLNVLLDFLVGFVVGRSARNSAQTARNSAEIAKFAAMTESQKAAYQKREQYLAGQKRFVFGLFAVIMGVVWIAGALTGGH